MEVSTVYDEVNKSVYIAKLRQRYHKTLKGTLTDI